jgi:RimJ/RimL family protein N-acetyltransferase
MEPTEISAGRLHLRPWTSYDEPALVELFSDPESVRWTPAPVPFTSEDARRRLLEGYPQMWESGTGAVWAVCDATTGEVMGWAAVFEIADGAGEIGWGVSPGARGKGVASDAVPAVARWAFEALGLRRLEAVIIAGNWTSVSVAQKCGFTLEGVRRRGGVQRGAVVDVWVASLLAEDEITDRRPLPADPGLTDGQVSLRWFRPEDAADVARACSDPLTARWLPVPVPYTLEDGRTYVEDVVPVGWADGTSATFAVVSAQDGGFLGDISLKLPHRDLRFGEVGYWTAPWARGQGVASRATRLVADWGLRELGLNRVELLAEVGNVASQRVAEKAGFVREGVVRRARPARDGSGLDMVLFGRTLADL